MSGVIAGASSFLNAATLANTRGLAAQAPTLLGDGGLGGASLQDALRSLRPDNGIGLSSRARAANQRFLESASANANTIFSLGIGTTSSVEALQQQILALRAQTPDSQLARSLIDVETAPDDGVAVDNGAAAASDTGTTVDTEA